MAGAARLARVVLRIVRDRVLRFDAEVPAGLLDRKAPGPAGPAHETAYAFGAIRPAMGEAAGLVMPWADTSAMGPHPAEISRAVDPGAHAVVILDQAGRRMSRVTSPLIPDWEVRYPEDGGCVTSEGPRRRFTTAFREQAVARLSGPGVRQAGVARDGGRIFAARRLAARAGDACRDRRPERRQRFAPRRIGAAGRA